METQTTFCTFYVDGILFGVDVSDVQEVLRHQNMTEVPLAPDFVRGLMNLRGQIVTALDMRKVLALTDVDIKPERMNVLIRSGESVVSLLVDRIGDVITVEPEQFELAPESVSPEVRKMIHGVYKLEGKLLLQLNTGSLHSLDLAEIAEPAVPQMAFGTKTPKTRSSAAL